MSSNSVESSKNICVICYKNVNIYSVGNCDHMVCYECSTRMRVLCCQNECPICRQDLPKVIFTYSLKPFSTVARSALYEDKKYQIHFQDKKIQDAFYKLLEHCCSICANRMPFRTFQHLSEHMRKEHELYYCDLCVDNLKIFTSERRCYNRNDLALHRSKGDPDDRSHRGHPLCEFCQVRFMDNDFLYRHLRKDHLFCHFCDADGQDLYYSCYDYLQDHFREEHYLCEEGECVVEKFTSVFRTEIDLKAHRMSVHGKSMGKAAAKQARTLELQFTLKPRPGQENFRKPKSSHHDSSGVSEGTIGLIEEPQPRMNSASLDPSDFPSLPSGSGVITATAPQRRGRLGGVTMQAVSKRNSSLAVNDENFPVLGDHNDNSQGALMRPNGSQDRSDNSSKHGSHRPNGERNIKIKQDDFPALASNSMSSLPTAKWVSTSNTNTASNTSSKQSKKVKQPLSDSDFPGLNSKFNTNLNLKLNEPLKPNYVNIRSSKGDGKHANKASSVTMPGQNESLDTSESLTSNLKAKVKKKKSKGNSDEEKSDTAKKKDDKNATHRTKGISVNLKNNPSAFSEKTDDSQTMKPLPTAEDWFGSSKKPQTTSGKKNKADINVDSSPRTTNKTSSSEIKCNLSKLTKCSKGERSSSANSDKNVMRKVEKKVPPGFDDVSSPIKNNDAINPPPGFSFDLPCSNGLTLTNSSGQSFAMPTNFVYTSPLNFEKRNQELVTKVFHILSNDSKLDQFKRMSALFRQDMLSADEYYNHCMKTLGENGFREVFPELLILLPDIDKQQELFRVFSRSSKFDEEKTQLLSCETCRQVLRCGEIKEHLAQHSLQENFPLLIPSNWTK